MSKIAISLAQHFSAFAGDKAARVALVAEALVSAVTMAAVHGQQGAIVEALSSLGTLKGQARAVEALRQGVAASGLTLSTNGRAVQCTGLRVGKMPADAGEALAQEIGDRFTIAAGLVLNATVDKPKASGLDKACKALEALNGVDTRDLAKALRTNDGAALLARIALIAAQADKAARGEAVNPTKVEAPAVGVPA